MALNYNGVRQKIFYTGQWMRPNFSESDGNTGNTVCLMSPNKYVNEVNMMTQKGILTDDLIR